MQKISLIIIAAFLTITSGYAQTQKGNILLGSDISQLNLDFQSTNTAFAINIDPKAGIFFKDNRLLGAQITFGLSTQNKTTTIQYGLSAFGRYYFGTASTGLDRKTKWFIEINAGIVGSNISGSNVEHSSTNGLGAGIGPGLSYFISRTVALEALAKYNLTTGFGNSIVDNAINANLGFQIFLSGIRLNTVPVPKQ
jgi:hypothetical protein